MEEKISRSLDEEIISLITLELQRLGGYFFNVSRFCEHLKLCYPSLIALTPHGIELFMRRHLVKRGSVKFIKKSSRKQASWAYAVSTVAPVRVGTFIKTKETRPEEIGHLQKEIEKLETEITELQKKADDLGKTLGEIQHQRDGWRRKYEELASPPKKYVPIENAMVVHSGRD